MIEAFLSSVGWADATRSPLAPDASARQYWRLTDSARRAVLMLAPTDTAEARDSIAAFRRIGAHLLALELSAPLEIAADVANGLILMEDLGDRRLSKMLDADDPRLSEAYSVASEGLAHIAAASPPDGLADPGPTGLAGLVELTFTLLPHNGGTLRNTLLSALADAIAAHASGPPTLSLRDVHGDNLMWCPERVGVARIGWLDYQDAVLLPGGYDLASLLDDPRREVPDDISENLIRTYSDHRRFAVLSLARNLRILGIFRRLATKLGKPGYCAFLPRTRALIERRVEAFPSLRMPVHELLTQTEHWL